MYKRQIFGFEPPMFQGYEFIGIKGSTGKMSGSSGLNLTPETLLKIYEPEVILWLYSKTDPKKAFDFCFDEGIPVSYTHLDVYKRQENSSPLSISIDKDSSSSPSSPVLVFSAM